MLRKRQSQHTTLCVLRVRSDVLDIPGAVVTDGNAVALRYTAYVAAPEGLRIVDRELTFAEWWTASDIIVYWRRKSAKMAEILVPDRVPPEFLTGAYVSCEESLARFEALGTGVPATVNSHLFFL